MQQAKRPGDLVLASVHWGSNWGYRVPEDQVRFAHGLIDGGVDVVHGHSSHHPRPVEVHRDRLILYGCGDLIDDYEGIAGHEAYRADLRLLYLASVQPDTGTLMRLRRTSAEDTQWLRAVLDGISRGFGSRVSLEPDGVLALRRA